MQQHELDTVETADGLVTLGNPVTHWAVRATKPVSYEIRVSDDLFALDNTTLLEDVVPGTGSPRRVVVIDAVVDELYGRRIRKYLDHHGVIHRICTLDSGETAKDLSNALRVVDTLDEFGIDRRREPVIAIGGGVLMDMVGFVCSAYRRATPYIRVPTTLIGLVDAGVGVKTGLNNNGHKNRLGSYFPAARTLLDRTFLTTLDTRHISNGLAEILKIGLIKDVALFELLEEHAETLLTGKLQRSAGAADDVLGQTTVEHRLSLGHQDLEPATEVLERAISGMLEELQPNLWEEVLERVVDYGHTFSPTVEMHALPALLHGEAVAVDMALTTVLAQRRGLVDITQQRRILRLMERLNLPTWHELLTPEVLVPALQDTVRHRDGQQRLPLPIGIGAAVFVNNVSEAELIEAASALAAEATR
ncbi:sedoheptulose 7-phosphate cyclase [Lentzea sp. NPDC051213]|uniref:sedoheptulose 7-phosphate cyclase n=1 Tax=Lentzea sp. NPDC051213 TaxID=3364126 RepID=UPI00379E7BD6